MSELRRRSWMVAAAICTLVATVAPVMGQAGPVTGPPLVLVNQQDGHGSGRGRRF